MMQKTKKKKRKKINGKESVCVCGSKAILYVIAKVSNWL